MTLQEITDAMKRIGCLTFTTLHEGEMHSRIIHVCGGDDDGIYFLTMSVKPFYRQLTASGKVAVCGMYPESRPTGKNDVGQPAFVPGYTFRLTGDVHEIDQDVIEEKAAAGSDVFQFFLEDQDRYPDCRLFCIHKGKGEIFDFDFEMANRDHKLLRTRFGFGGATCNEAGARITDECIACGACLEVCTFKAIEEGEPYRVNGARCDECGSCFEVCPQDAITLSHTM